MATSTLGTAATTTLTAIPFSASVLAADMATVAQGILNDLAQAASPPVQIYPGAFSNHGLLYVPNRGVLTVRPGDFVAIDATGWPILLSAIAAASASWVHAP